MVDGGWADRPSGHEKGPVRRAEHRRGAAPLQGAPDAARRRGRDRPPLPRARGHGDTLEVHACEYRAGDDDLRWLALRVAMLGVDFRGARATELSSIYKRSPSARAGRRWPEEGAPLGRDRVRLNERVRQRGGARSLRRLCASSCRYMVGSLQCGPTGITAHLQGTREREPRPGEHCRHTGRPPAGGASSVSSLFTFRPRRPVAACARD